MELFVCVDRHHFPPTNILYLNFVYLKYRNNGQTYPQTSKYNDAMTSFGKANIHLYIICINIWPTRAGSCIIYSQKEMEFLFLCILYFG